jgi:hypothetical protein
MSRQGNRPKPISHGILNRLYAEPLALRDAIARLAPDTDLAGSLVRLGDSKKYAEDLLQRTIVCFRSPLPVLQQPWRLSQRYGQQQVGQACKTAVAVACCQQEGIKQQNDYHACVTAVWIAAM